MKLKQYVLGCLAMGLSIAAFAEPFASIEAVSTYGSGCRKKTVSAVLSPDRSSASVLFSNYILDSEEKERELSCLIVLKVNVQPKVKMKVLSSDYRGFAFAEGKDSVSLFAQLQMASRHDYQTSRVHERKFKNFDDEFIFQPQTKLSSDCGRSVYLYFYSSMQMKHPKKKNGQSLAQLDSFDFSLLDHTSFSTCKK